MYTEGMTTPRMRMGRCGCGAADTRDTCDNPSPELYGDMMDDCTCGYRQTWGLEGYPTAMVFAPLQRFDNIYDLDTAMKRGTVFQDLDLPFMGSDNGKGGCCNG